MRKKFTEFKKTNNKEEDGVSDGDDVSVDVDVDVDDDDVKEEERKFELCKNDCVFFFHLCSVIPQISVFFILISRTTNLFY